jgi:transposase
VLGALRVLSKWEQAAETMRAALNALAAADPEWLTEHADPQWFERYGRRIEDQRLPKGKKAREVQRINQQYLPGSCWRLMPVA